MDKLPQIVIMETKFFSLEIRENSKLVRIFQIGLGVGCLLIAGFWVVFNIRSVKADNSLWLTVAFLCGFGVFQIYSGLGYANKFIEFSDTRIKLKKNSLLPLQLIEADQVDRTEVYPLKVHIILKSSKKILIRFGVTNADNLELVKDEIISFASRNSISLEIKND
jgi:hypothetical protein